MAYINTDRSNTHTDPLLGSRWAQMWVYIWVHVLVIFDGICWSSRCGHIQNAAYSEHCGKNGCLKWHDHERQQLQNHFSKVTLGSNSQEDAIQNS